MYIIAISYHCIVINIDMMCIYIDRLLEYTIIYYYFDFSFILEVLVNYSLLNYIYNDNNINNNSNSRFLIHTLIHFLQRW
jgi:hypothetical protein